MSDGVRLGFVLVICLGTGLLAGCSHEQKTATSSWNPRLAPAYLDHREVAWMNWPGAARDHGTFCVSCHTNVAYALSRPVLRKALSEPSMTPSEEKLLADVTKRVRLWNEIDPYYTDAQYHDGGKATESRGTESVLNALILFSYDALNGSLSDVTRAAFDNMWALQETRGNEKGAWRWLQFDMEPWEAKDSQYYGAALAAIAVGTAPENYRLGPDVQDKLIMLRDYLNREYPRQSAINHVVWASTKLPGLLGPERRNAIVKEVLDNQEADGGWKLSALSWPGSWSLHSLVQKWVRSDGTTQDQKSDGYANGLITFALQRAGIPSNEPQIKRGLAWLDRNQNSEEGSWASLVFNETPNFVFDPRVFYERCSDRVCRSRID